MITNIGSANNGTFSIGNIAQQKGMTIMLGKIKGLFQLMMLFSSYHDITTYRKIRDSRFEGDLAGLGLREIGNRRLLIRPGTTDLKVLLSTFVDKHHVPMVRIPRNGTIVDLGGYTGFTPCHFAYQYPQARVVAVEMDRANFDLALKNTEAFNPRCQMVHAAVWAEDGTVTYEGTGAWGFHITGNSDGDQSNQVSVSAISLKSLFSEYNIERVDYLKMDIEGAEAAVLEASDPWIGQVGAFNLECHPYHNPKSTVEYCQSLLEKHGFQCRSTGKHPLSLTAIHPERSQWLD